MRNNASISNKQALSLENVPILSNEEIIVQTRDQLNQCIDELGDKLHNTIKFRMMSQQAMHSRTISDKNRYIGWLQSKKRDYQTKFTMNQAIQHLSEEMYLLSQENIHLGSELQICKKQHALQKRRADILQLQLKSCEKREKDAKRRVWSLEEEFKQLYSEDPLKPVDTSKIITNNDCDSMKPKLSFQTSKIQQKNDQTLLSQRQNLIFKLSGRYSGRQIYNKKSVESQFPQQIVKKNSLSNNSIRVKIQKSLKSQSLTHNFRSRYESIQKVATIQKKINEELYQDLKKSLRERKPSSGQSQREQDKSIKVEEFKKIMKEGKSILVQIENIFIQKYGRLKHIDSTAIQTLKLLIANENAMKILEIILFNFVSAHQEAIYQQIKINSSEEIKKILMNTRMNPKLKMQKQMHKKFKSQIASKRLGIHSSMQKLQIFD